MITLMNISNATAFRWMVDRTPMMIFNIVLGNSLLPSSNKPLSEPMSNKVHDAI